MARLLVGMPTFKGKLETYSASFDVVEVRPVDTPLPKLTKLAKWRERVPPSFAFSVVLPREVATLAKSDDALKQAVETARVLQANCIVLATPASVRPTKANRDRIRELAASLPADAHTLAWSAAGMWEVDDVMATADAAGWLPIFDAAQAPLAPGPVVYTRIRSLGHATRLGADRIDHIAHQLAGRREAVVIVEGDQARKVRAELRAAVERLDGGHPAPKVFRPQQLTADDEEQ
jgi:uncharacterized protein YecE (DUF72 family)